MERRSYLCSDGFYGIIFHYSGWNEVWSFVGPSCDGFSHGFLRLFDWGEFLAEFVVECVVGFSLKLNLEIVEFPIKTWFSKRNSIQDSKIFKFT